MSSSITKKIPRFFSHLVLLFFVIISVYPLFWMVLSSLKTLPDFTSNMWGLPKEIMLSNYVVAWEKGIGTYLRNSLIIASVTTILVVFFGAMAAYPFARTGFLGKNALYFYLFLGMMAPVAGIVIPIFYLAKNYQIANNYIGVILPYVALNLPFAVLVMRGFYFTLPPDLEDAARIDGCSELNIFLKIIWPLSINGLITIAIFTFLASWNEFFLSLVLLYDENLKTLPTGLSRFTVTIGMGQITYFPALFAAISIITLPIVILFVFLQKYFISGITQGGVKF